MLVSKVPISTFGTQTQQFHDIQGKKQVWAPRRDWGSIDIHIGVVDPQGWVLAGIIWSQVLQCHDATIWLHLGKQRIQITVVIYSCYHSTWHKLKNFLRLNFCRQTFLDLQYINTGTACLIYGKARNQNLWTKALKHGIFIKSNKLIFIDFCLNVSYTGSAISSIHALTVAISPHSQSPLQWSHYKRFLDLSWRMCLEEQSIPASAQCRQLVWAHLLSCRTISERRSCWLRIGLSMQWH